MEVDKSNPYQLYCWEFQESLIKFYNEDSGNWFGRLIAFECEIYIVGDVYTQEDLQEIFANGNVEINKIKTDFPNVTFTPADPSNPAKYQSGLITSQVEIEMEIDGKTLNQIYTVTHQVKPAFQTKLTNIG